jgi:SAM-dependent methyltransferase
MLLDRSRGRMAIGRVSNPWLAIPLDDYEGHMTHPQVAQATVLADLFEQAVTRYSPDAIAVVGCAGGNGFERISDRIVERVVAIDINPQYIEQARARFAPRVQNLELLCADVQADSLSYGPVDFTFAALLFEYVELGSTLRTVKRNCRPNAKLTTVLQLPHAALPAVSSSPYRSLRSLESLMALVPPEELHRAALLAGFCANDAATIELPGGKRFHVQHFTA